MKVGVLREIKPDEGRVALTPAGVAALVARGHPVFVEPEAGARAGYPDPAYAAAGAALVAKAEVLAQAGLVLKVKAPLPEEFGDYRPDQVLFTFLHFDENIAPEAMAALIGSGVLGLACEAVRVDGRFPLLEPMSRLTGYLFAQRGLELCAGAKGVFAPAPEGALPGGRAVLLGTGEIGLSVLRYLSALGVRLTVVANRDRAAVNGAANRRFGTTATDYLPERDVTFWQMNAGEPERTQDAIAAALAGADILINAAVRRSTLPRERLPHLVTRAMLGAMQPGSVVCDATACDRDLIETCVSSPWLQHRDQIDGLVHYSPDHIPALVARTATDLFTSASLPFVLALADGGLAGALARWPTLVEAVACLDGVLTDQRAAQAKGLPAQSAAARLAARRRP